MIPVRLLYWVAPTVADQDPGSGAFLLPGSGMNFFRVPDPESGLFFGEICLHYLQNPFVFFMIMGYS
jgi:hypothetical protein